MYILVHTGFDDGLLRVHNTLDKSKLSHVSYFGYKSTLGVNLLGKSQTSRSGLRWFQPTVDQRDLLRTNTVG